MSIVLNSRLKYYIIPLAFILSVFFIIPFELYYNAQIYWGWKKLIPFTINLFGIFLYVVIVLFLNLFFRINNKNAAKIISFLIFLVGAFILFADVFAPLQTNIATGEQLVSTEPAIYTIIEFIILSVLSILRASTSEFL